MSKISFLFLVLCFVVACATQQKYDAKLGTWIGKTQSQLIEKWGRPSAQKYLVNGDKVLTYTKANDVYVPSEFYVYNQGFEPSEDVVYSPFINNYDFSPAAASFGYTVDEICQTSFLLKNGVVTGWKWKGNACVSY